MRFTKLLALPVITAGVVPGIHIPPDIEHDFDYRLKLFSTEKVYGQFSTKENTLIRFSCLTGKTTTITGSLRGYNSSGANVYHQGIDFSQGLLSNYVSLETKTRLTNQGHKISVTFYQDSEEIYYAETTLKLPTKKTITANGGTYEYEGVCFGIEKEVLINKETYDFSSTNEYYTIDNRGSLDLSELNFNYSPKKSFIYKEANLLINDYENIYPNISKIEGTNTIKIPVEISENKGTVSFAIKSKMYVNNMTLDMSDRKMEGYVETDNFYVPSGRGGDLERNESSVVIEEAGFNVNTIIIPLSYFLDRNYFGSCHNSEVCIHGGIKEWLLCF